MDTVLVRTACEDSLKESPTYPTLALFRSQANRRLALPTYLVGSLRPF